VKCKNKQTMAKYQRGKLRFTKAQKNIGDGIFDIKVITRKPPLHINLYILIKSKHFYLYSS